ncbi:hypothetical protein MSG28_014036 [Choristoneura fumiferana]|uniref:Uncharacterized protein n=1 Tax=Choristoneura fumiferana TaxID=7141 RepID=A0ACC0JFM1_CHOFU|nr:hypothetical protein MSG28_014036 [Choristoneura fumiferana]
MDFGGVADPGVDGGTIRRLSSQLVVGPCARSIRIATTILLANPSVKQQCLHCCVLAWRPVDVHCRTLDCMHREPATLTRSSVHLVGGRPALRLPINGLYSRTFGSNDHLFSVLYAYCNFNELIRLAMSVILVHLRISSKNSSFHSSLSNSEPIYKIYKLADLRPVHDTNEGEDFEQCEETPQVTHRSTNNTNSFSPQTPTKIAVTCDRGMSSDIAKLRYNGKTCVRSFVQRVKEFLAARNLKPEKILQHATEIFEGDALHWFRSVKDSIDNWHDLSTQLIEVFSLHDYDYRLKSEIRARTQGESENITIYLSIMHGMFSRLTVPFTEEEQLEIVLHNIRPCFATVIATAEKIDNLNTLRKLCHNYEVVHARMSQFREPPRANSDTLAPEFAYNKQSSFLNSPKQPYQGKIPQWTPEAEQAFLKLKACLVTTPVLSCPNFDLPFEVHTDASDYGVGGCCLSRNTVMYMGQFCKDVIKIEPSSLRIPELVDNENLRLISMKWISRGQLYTAGLQSDGFKAPRVVPGAKVAIKLAALPRLMAIDNLCTRERIRAGVSHLKYSASEPTYDCVPFAVETAGLWCGSWAVGYGTGVATPARGRTWFSRWRWPYSGEMRLALWAPLSRVRRAKRGVVSFNCDHDARAERAKRACRGSGRRSARTDLAAFHDMPRNFMICLNWPNHEMAAVHDMPRNFMICLNVTRQIVKRGDVVGPCARPAQLATAILPANPAVALLCFGEENYDVVAGKACRRVAANFAFGKTIIAKKNAPQETWQKSLTVTSCWLQYEWAGSTGLDGKLASQVTIKLLDSEGKLTSAAPKLAHTNSCHALKAERYRVHEIDLTLAQSEGIAQT